MTALTTHSRPARLRHIRDPRCRKAAAAPQVDAWLDWLEARQLSPASILAYEKRVQPLLRLYPEVDFEDFEEHHLVAAINSVPKASRHPVITALTSLFRTWAKKRRLIGEDPTENLNEFRKRHKPRVVPTFTDAEALALTALPGEAGLRMLFFFDTGLRIGEVCNLRCRDILVPQGDDENDYGELVVLKGKGDKDRVIPLTRRLSLAYWDWHTLNAPEPDNFVFGHLKPGGSDGILHRALPLSEDAVRKWFYKQCDLVGARRLRPHATRHTYATKLLRRDASIAKVSKLLGHSSVDTTMKTYAHLVTGDLRSVVELLEI